jgi:tRNA threonylcarbamoyladenosine biosynthesis protein TsaE
LKKSVLLHSSSDEETINLGIDLGTVLTEGDVVALVGELGSGKTWFTKGLALGLGVSPDTIITSPSFTLMNEYAGRCTLFHMDAYRLEGVSDFLSAGLDEYFFQGGVVVMEWADRWPELLPDRRLVAEITIADYDAREITMSGFHPRAIEILKTMAEGERKGLS